MPAGLEIEEPGRNRAYANAPDCGKQAHKVSGDDTILWDRGMQLAFLAILRQRCRVIYPSRRFHQTTIRLLQEHSLGILVSTSNPRRLRMISTAS